MRCRFVAHPRRGAVFAADLGSVGNAAAAFSANDFVGGDAVFCGGGDLGDYRTHGYCGNRFRKNHSDDRIKVVQAAEAGPALFKKLECVTAIP